MKVGDKVYHKVDHKRWEHYGEIKRVNSTRVIIERAAPPYEMNKTNEDIKHVPVIESVDKDCLSLIAGFDTFDDYELLI